MASDDSLFALAPAGLIGVGTLVATPATVAPGTNNLMAVMNFDAAQTEEAMSRDAILMPGQYDGTSALEVAVTVAMDSANTSAGVRLDVKIMRLGANQDIAADGFATAQSVTLTVDDDADQAVTGVVAFTNAEFDGVQPNEWFLLHIQRDHDHAGDDATGDMQLIGIEGRLA